MKATEEFLEENRTKLDPKELASLQERLCQAKEQYQSLQERTEAAQKELESAVSTVVQQQTEKVQHHTTWNWCGRSLLRIRRELGKLIRGCVLSSAL